MMEPVNERIWFAGEAAHETLWGTVGGAWGFGERAAEAGSVAPHGRAQDAGAGSRDRAQAHPG